MKKLYIDIDGVLLTTKQTAVADHAIQFIDFMTCNFDCYWLTTHCKGNITNSITYLSKYFDNLTLEKLKTIKPTNWTTLKTEAIDFSADFLWLDDNPFVSEKSVLNTHFAADKLIMVKLDNKDELKRILEILKYALLN